MKKNLTLIQKMNIIKNYLDKKSTLNNNNKFYNKKKIYNKKKHYGKKKFINKNYVSIKHKINKYKAKQIASRLTDLEAKIEFKQNFESMLLNNISNQKINFFEESLDEQSNYWIQNLARVKMPNLNLNFLIQANKKIDLNNHLLFPKVFNSNLKKKLFLIKTNFNIKERWKCFNFFVFKKKILRKKRKKLKYRILFNTNLEINSTIFAYTIISKEFFSFQKFLKIQPHYFTNKINKFIRHFF